MRPIYKIAEEISADWKKPYFGAVPYISAMRRLSSIDDNYGLDSGRSIVLYFLSNATTWRGETARRIKKELNDIIKGKSSKIRKESKGIKKVLTLLEKSVSDVSLDIEIDYYNEFQYMLIELGFDNEYAQQIVEGIAGVNGNNQEFKNNLIKVRNAITYTLKK